MGTNDTEAVDDGTTTEPVADTTQDAGVDDGTGGGEPADDEDPIKAIQKLTGKLTQKMRDTVEQLESDNIKYILNSIISASDVKKLSDEDKTDILNKIEDKEEDEPMAENDEPMVDEPKFYEGILNDKTVKHIIDMAGLTYEASEDPENIAFDFAEAAFIFIQDYNENNEFIGKLNTLLYSNDFKPSMGLRTKDDLEYYGQEIYDALVKHEMEHGGEVFNEIGSPDAAFYTASGGQTIGEDTQKRLQTILEQARINVRNKLNKG